MKTISHFKSLLTGNLSLALLLIIFTVFTSCKQGEKTGDTTTAVEEQPAKETAPQADAEADAMFVADAATVNMEEIDLGKLAQEKGTSKDVKDFGKMMVEGHTKSLNELKDLAAKKGITLPTDVSEKGKATKEELMKAEGKDFDKLYASKMVDGHTETISKFESERDNGGDADIKAWAEKTLPDLKMHLDHAVMVQQKLK